MKNACYLLFGLLFFSVISMNFTVGTSENKAEVPRPSQSHNYSGYDETDFVEIILNPNDIEYGDFECGTSQNTVLCEINITYPSTGNLWQFIFPSHFSDAGEYYIRRSSTEYYYCTDDEFSEEARYRGENSYWIIPATNEITDLLKFTLILPTFYIDTDLTATNSSTRTFLFGVSRFDEAVRSYSPVIFTHEINKYFDLFSIQVFNLTGGTFSNITDSVDLSYSVVEKGFGEVIRFTMDLGYIQNATDYVFKLVLSKERASPSFWDGWVVQAGIPFVIGLIMGFLVYPYVYQYVFRRPEIRRNSKTDLKLGLPIAIAIGIIMILISYAYYRVQGV
jgi:hypothetical protein